MATTRLTFERAAIVSDVEKNKHYSAGTVFGATASEDADALYLICGLSAYPDGIKFREITKASYNAYLSVRSSIDRLNVEAIDVPFDENSVTFNDVSGPVFRDLCSFRFLSESGWNSHSLYAKYVGVKNAIKYGTICAYSAGVGIETPYGTNKPYIDLTYGTDDVGLNVSQTYPTGEATISKAIATTFTWTATPQTEATLEPIKAASAILRWKYAGASSYAEIPCSSSTQHTVPANTFAEGTILWQIVVTANSGVVTTSDWMTTEVREPLSSAVALSPMNSIVDGSTAQAFVWEHIISNGTEQYAFDLQTSPDASAWTTIRHALTAQTKTEFAAGTFAAGDLWWRVRTYNLAGTAGAWSEPVRCIVLAAPTAPSITADDTSPRFVLRWQQSGQQAYELMVDGVVVAKTFSAESIYRHNGYLEPGTHKVQVRIQNKYQMWSDWGAANLQIENVTGEAIQLSAEGDNEVALSWSTSGSYGSFIVYRNGVKIAETASSSYVDHFAIGETLYQVRGVYADSGYYTLSDTATVAISPKTLLIANVSNPVWIKLPLSTSSLRSAGLSASQSVTYTHYIGSELPGAEIGEAVRKSYDIDCAFKATDLENIRQFEALLGKIVCLKTPSQRRIIGVMSQMSAKENLFYVAYSAPITEVRWEEMQA